MVHFSKINGHGAKRNSPFATVNDDEIKIVMHFAKINGRGAKKKSPFATVNDDEIKIVVHFAKIHGRGAKGNLPFAIVNGAEKNSGRLIKKGFSFYTKVLYKMKCTLVFTSCKFSSTQFWRCHNSGWPLRQGFLVAGDERDYLCADGTSTPTHKASSMLGWGGLVGCPHRPFIWASALFAGCFYKPFGGGSVFDILRFNFNTLTPAQCRKNNWAFTGEGVFLECAALY